MTKREKALICFAVFVTFCFIVRVGNPPLISWARVCGDSMEPTFSDGDYLVFHYQSGYTVGDVVYAWWIDEMLVKRVVSFEGDRVHITGDNVDEAYNFVVAPGDIGGKLLCRIWRGHD